jgi:hypothetical protein
VESLYGVSSTPRTGPLFCIAANSHLVPIPDSCTAAKRQCHSITSGPRGPAVRVAPANDSAVPLEAQSAPNQRTFLDNPCHAKQIDGVHRGAAKCWLRTYPLNLPGSCQRRECSMPKTTVLLCRSREPTVTVPRVRWVS